MGVLQHARAAARARSRSCPVARAVDDEDLADDARLLEALLAPVDEVADGQLLVGRRNDDRELGLGDVVLRRCSTTSGSEPSTTPCGPAISVRPKVERGYRCPAARIARPYKALSKQLLSTPVLTSRGIAAACRICSSPADDAGRVFGRVADREFQLSRCRACGFAFVVDPLPEPETTFDYYAGADADPLVDYVGEIEYPEETIRIYEWRGLVNVVGALVPLRPETRWLDFGCGTGGLVRHCRDALGVDIVGYEQGEGARLAGSAGTPTGGRLPARRAPRNVRRDHRDRGARASR